MLISKDIILSDTPYKKHATIYTDSDTIPKASLLYFHGGGLLYGIRTDLPELHLKKLTKSGFMIVSFDYPLTPMAKVGLIIDDVIASINHYIKHPNTYTIKSLPYFLFGRSAGAYLCLMATVSGKLSRIPNGVVSYYGYGFLCDNWYNVPSSHYNTLPKVSESCLTKLPAYIETEGFLDTHYNIYVYARQSGLWKSLFYEGREKYFFLDFSLRVHNSFPCPLFCAHSINDTDVPYSEFLALCAKFQPQRFVASRTCHDFDRIETDPLTEKLLDATIAFLDKHLH